MPWPAGGGGAARRRREAERFHSMAARWGDSKLTPSA